MGLSVLTINKRVRNLSNAIASIFSRRWLTPVGLRLFEFIFVFPILKILPFKCDVKADANS